MDKLNNEFSNHLITFILKSSNYNISLNPNLTIDIIKQNMDKPWDWVYISQNPFNGEKQQYIIDNLSLLIYCKEWLI